MLEMNLIGHVWTEYKSLGVGSGIRQATSMGNIVRDSKSQHAFTRRDAAATQQGANIHNLKKNVDNLERYKVSFV